MKITASAVSLNVDDVAASVRFLTAHFGFPVSTTHVVSTAVLGSGAATRFSAVRWGIARNIVVAWLITLPCAGLAGGLVELLTRAPAGVPLTFALTLVIAAAALAARRIQTHRLGITPA